MSNEPTPPPAGTYPASDNVVSGLRESPGGDEGDLMEEIIPFPTIGRIVLYVLPSGEMRPAIVTELPFAERQYLVSLTVFTVNNDVLPGGTKQIDVPVCPTPRPGTWHWPSRG